MQISALLTIKCTFSYIKVPVISQWTYHNEDSTSKCCHQDFKCIKQTKFEIDRSIDRERERERERERVGSLYAVFYKTHTFKYCLSAFGGSGGAVFKFSCTTMKSSNSIAVPG